MMRRTGGDGGGEGRGREGGEGGGGGKGAGGEAGHDMIRHGSNTRRNRIIHSGKRNPRNIMHISLWDSRSHHRRYCNINAETRNCKHRYLSDRLICCHWSTQAHKHAYAIGGNRSDGAAVPRTASVAFAIVVGLQVFARRVG